jgi:hypothetical protein
MTIWECRPVLGLVARSVPATQLPYGASSRSNREKPLNCTEGQIGRFEWPIRAETVPQVCWWRYHRGPGQRLMAPLGVPYRNHL